VFATVAAVAQPLIGHFLGIGLSDMQPAKLAAIDLAPTTERAAPLRIGGLLIDGEVKGALVIPRLGSIVSRESLTKPVPGLDTVAPADRPPPNITHLSFQLMVGAGLILVFAVFVYWLVRRRGHDLLANRWFARVAVLTGPLAILALECGWTVTEVGRQPWTVWQIMRTSQAASWNGGLWWSYAAIIVIYVGMTIGAYVVLRSMSQRWREGKAVASPTGRARHEARAMPPRRTSGRRHDPPRDGRRRDVRRSGRLRGTRRRRLRFRFL
jgi:cytochrome d ubiquinol oxidase subunit I